MRIGVICEGPTDYVAIESFFGAALADKNFDVTFVSLQPDMDATQSHGGWTLVESWLSNNPPESRIHRYFGGGLFESDLDTKQCDVFLIQIDSDILDDESFVQSVQTKFNIDASGIVGSVNRRKKIINILNSWCDLSKCSGGDIERHIMCPAVESTEAWCIAAVTRHADIEGLSKTELIVPFMTAMHRSESREIPEEIIKIDKSTERRKRFCVANAAGHGKLASQCQSFSLALQDLTKNAPNFIS